MASQNTLRAEGLFERYLTHLPAAIRDEIVQLGAPCWLPITIGVAHYTACNRLGLNEQQTVALAQRVAMRGEGSFLGIAANLARGAGVTPWSVADRAPRLWARAFQGGAMDPVKLGPKELRIDVRGWTCASIPYCRHAMRGLALGTVKLLSRDAYARELPVAAPTHNVSLQLSWV